MLDFLRGTHLRVLAIGTISALVILWLSASFWVGAWQESADVRRFERLLVLEQRLHSSAHDFAAERELVLGAMDLAAGGALVLDEGTSIEATLERLRVLRAHSDAAVAELIDATSAVLATPDLLGHTRYGTDSQRTDLERLDAALLALRQHRSRFDARLTGEREDPANPMPDTRTVLSALRVHTSIVELERELDRLRNDFRPEFYAARPELDNLERLRSVLHEFGRAEQTRSALRALSTTYGPTNGARASLSRALAQASIASRDAVNSLRRILKLDGDMIDRQVHAELRSILEEHDRLVSAPSPAGPSVNRALHARVLALDARLAEATSERVDAVRIHSYRNLAIDSTLIVGSFWLVFFSLRLLERLRHHAQHDPLTALPNRASFEERLRDASAEPRRGEADGMTLLIIGIDDFKSINDTFGHDVGDELIRCLGARLAARLGEDTMLAALGGDEFAVLWRSESREETMETAERLREACEEPFGIEGSVVHVTLSIGASGPEDHAPDMPGLLGRASIALRQAKDAGKDQVHAFSPELAERNRIRVELKRELRHAVSGGQLELHYQPKVDTGSGRVSGVEALARWRHPERGFISPGTFIPMAERCGMIVPIGAWVLEEAVRQTASWHRAGLDGLQIAVNVSAQQLTADDFVESVESVLLAHGLPPDRLELEVTESVGMMDMKMVVARLTRLRAQGVSVAIDDFGTDYSSLQYLEDLPLDTLKIDRSFVVKLDRVEHDRSLVNTIVQMARSLGLRTVAEGVETEEQLGKVSALGCDQVQGYYHSRPVCAEELPAVVARLNADAADGDEQRSAA